MNKKKEKAKETIGGIPFFVSLVSLALISASNTYFLYFLFNTIPDAENNLIQFGMGAVIGAWAASMLIKGHTSVLIHEVKHSIVSNLVGNRAKGMLINRKSGHFKYTYTKKTAKYNALIALAPYFLPVFTFCAVIASAIIYYQTNSKILFVIGLGWGLDIMLNFRDVSPIQTDITNITGGYRVGLSFIIAMNLCLVSILLAWVIDGLQGLQFLFAALWQFMVHLVAYYRGL